MNTLNQINCLLKHHLSLNNLYTDVKLWRLQDAPTGGRGIFANRDISPGEIIFTDYPLLIGPRAGNNFKYFCVYCYELNNLYACTKGCGLPVCSLECEQNHLKECNLIRKLSGKNFDKIIMEIFRCLSPLRVFLVNEKLQNLFKHFTFHSSVIHGGEIEAVQQYINFRESEVNFLKIICSILDTNTFATAVQKNDKQISVRALYPLSAFLNHSCCPNVTHLTDSHQQMIVKAANFIPKDSELFITYTSLLWATPLRRLTQYVTKHFWCHCHRCKDPKEFGANLCGLKCPLDVCKGIIYPINPLDNFSDWKCESCSSVILNKKVGEINSELGVFLRSVGTKNIGQLIDLIEDKLAHLVPPENHVNYEVKIKVIWCLGYKQNYLWTDLTIEQLNFKEKLCLEALNILEVLQLGLCKMRGLILYELYRTRFEKYSRIPEPLDDEENRLLLKEAAEILQNDACAPQEIIDYFNSCK